MRQLSGRCLTTHIRLLRTHTNPIPDPPFQFNLRVIPELDVLRPEQVLLARSRQRFLLVRGLGAWNLYLVLTSTAQNQHRNPERGSW